MEEITVSDEQIRAPQEGEAQEGRRIQVRDRGISTLYANFFTLTGGQDAVLLSFGNQFGNPDALQLEAKVVISPRNAKRMAVSLGHVIREYEKQYGEIDIRPPVPPPGAEQPS
jgi:hypothetical protein